MAIQGDKIMNLEDGQVLYNDLRRRIEKNAGVIEEVINTPSAVQTFDDGADNLPMALTVEIEPVQDLHGQESPYPAGVGKNLLLMTVANVKSLNTSGSWNGNVYTVNNVTITLQTDDGENVTGVKVNGTANAQIIFSCGNYVSTAETSIKFNGIPGTGSQSTYSINLFVGSTFADDVYSGDSPAKTISANTNVRYVIVIRSGYNAQSLMFYPMIRLSSVSDSTFAPYSNICPITGFTGAELTGTGFNLFDGEWEAGSIDGTTGQNTSGSTIWRTKNYIPCQPGTSYYLYAKGTSNKGTRARFYTKTKQYIGYIAKSGSGNTDAQITTPDNCYYMRFAPNTADFSADDFCINLFDSAKNGTYEAPKGNKQYDIDFPDEAGTVYGGTVTVNKDGSGSLVVDTGIVDLGDLTWNYISNKYFQSTDIIPYVKTGGGLSNNNPANAISSIFKIVAWNDSSATSGCLAIKLEGEASGMISCINSNYTDAATFKTAMAGQKLVYELATPVTYSLTAPQVKTLLGVNNIWADTGNILSVDYPADTKLYIDKKFAELSAAITALGT